MPELPEVETTRRGIAPRVEGCRVLSVQVREPSLRWPVPVQALERELVGQTIDQVQRRAKYLLLRTGSGTAILHLGMSGSLRLVAQRRPADRHDHVDLRLDCGQALRLTDPRRFGALGSHIRFGSTLDPRLRDAVEEQGASTSEISNNVQQAAQGSNEVSQNISGVREAADESQKSADQVLSASQDVSKNAERLRGVVDEFLTNVAAA